MKWADQMTAHSDTFREVWREHGLSIFVEDDPMQTFHEYDTAIKHIFTEFASGDLDSATSIINYLNGTAGVLKEDWSSNFNGVRRGVADWKGDAATGFGDYLDDTEDALESVLVIIDAARRAMVAYQDAMTALQNDVNELVEQTHDALDRVEQQEQEEGNRIGLTIVSAVIAVGAAALAVPTAGASMAAAVVAVGSALYSGASSVAVLQVGGSTERDVMISMVNQAQGVLDEAREARYRVEKALYEVTTFLTDAKPQDKSVRDSDVADLLPKRPAIVTDDKFDPDKFHPDDQPARDRRGIRDDDLVAEPDTGPDHERDHYLRPPENKVPKDQAPDPDVVWKEPIPGDPDAPDERPDKPGADIYDENEAVPDSGYGGGAVRG